jgi:hypothetical protein
VLQTGQTGGHAAVQRAARLHIGKCLARRDACGQTGHGKRAEKYGFFMITSSCWTARRFF